MKESLHPVHNVLLAESVLIIPKFVIAKWFSAAATKPMLQYTESWQSTTLPYAGTTDAKGSGKMA